VEFCELQIAGVLVEVGEVVMCLDVPWIVLQRAREVVERTRSLPPLEIDDAEVAISFSNVVALADCFELMLGRFRVALLV
jgi:hypothetical protein